MAKNNGAIKHDYRRPSVDEIVSKIGFHIRSLKLLQAELKQLDRDGYASHLEQFQPKRSTKGFWLAMALLTVFAVAVIVLQAVTGGC